MMLAVAGFTVPSFVLALRAGAGLRRAARLAAVGRQDSWRSAILPIVTLGLGGAAMLARFTRSAMLEVLGQPYIRTASAKGVPLAARRDRACAAQRGDPDRRPSWASWSGTLIAGAVVVESVFAWPGIGRLLVVGGRQPRPRGRAVHPAAGRRYHGDVQHDRRLPLWLPRSAPARARAGMIGSTLKPLSRSAVSRLLRGVAAAHARWRGRLDRADARDRAPAPSPRALWLHRARPARAAGSAGLLGGTVAHPLGTDELGRDVLSRLIVSIRTQPADRLRRDR